jgi:phosphate-selective porin OprO/OprP
MMKRLSITATALLLCCCSTLWAAEGGGPILDFAAGKGFSLKSADGDFDLNLGGRLQTRYTYYNYDSSLDYDGKAPGVQDTPTLSNFTVERFRVWFKGKAFKEWKYEFQADFGKGGAKLKDGYLQWSRRKQAAFTFGQFKTRFDRSEYTSSGKQMFVDRSLAASAFGIGRDIGVMFSGDSENMHFQYNLGAYNGEGEGGANPNDGHLFVGRISFNPNGNFGVSEVDINKSDTHLWFVDLAAAWHMDAWTDSSKDGKIQDAELNDVRRYAIGAGYRYAGLYTTAEYYARNTDFGASGVPDLDEHGWYAQAGYMLKPKVWSVGARYAYVEPNDDVDDNEKSEITLGVNRFFYEAGHNFKLTGDVSQLRTKVPGDTFKDTRVRLQWQLIF